jgi:putative ABC transport system permease protein
MSAPAESVWESAKRTLAFGEIVSLAIDSLRANKVRFALTALGMMVGSASLVLVVTVTLTGKQFVLDAIQRIGSNLIWAQYSGLVSAGANGSARDSLTIEDMKAVEQQLPSIRSASPVLNLSQQISIAGREQRYVLILGVGPEYAIVRHLVAISGRFFDDQDMLTDSKVAMVTKTFAAQHYGSTDSALEQKITIGGLSFSIVGVFREGIDTFGRSDIQDNTVLIPYPVARYFTGTDAVNLIYFSTTESDVVPQATRDILKVIKGRHRSESVYTVENFTDLIQVAGKSANALSMALLLFSTVTLISSGVGIMNIMLATVSARTREIGVRKAVGATQREILLQFLTEAVLISVAGGLAGTILGLAVPYSVRFLTDHRLPVSGLSAVVALMASCVVGITFGTLPARRAARMDVVDCLRRE